MSRRSRPTAPERPVRPPGGRRPPGPCLREGGPPVRSAARPEDRSARRRGERDQEWLDREREHQDPDDGDDLVAHERADADAERAQQRGHECVAADQVAQLARAPEWAGRATPGWRTRRPRPRPRSAGTAPARRRRTRASWRPGSARRSGAASSELVIVRWRHSPLIPTIARMRMKKLLVSDANTSTRTDSSVGSVSSATSDGDQQRGARRPRRRGRRRCGSCAA